MVAQEVEREGIDELVVELTEAVGRAKRARSDQQRVAREAVAIRIGDRLHAALLDLETVICEQRNWLDANRSDPRWASRRRAFDEQSLRQHAVGNEALLEAVGALRWRR